MTGRDREHVIDVRLLGPPRVERDGRPVAFDTRKALALLAHLALTERARPRDALVDLLWPDSDPDRARGALRRTLSTLRGAIGPDRLESTRDHVRLLPGPGLVVDVARFRELRAAGDHQGAAAVFRGDLLEGFAVREAPDFEDWVQAESESLRRELVATLARLAADREAIGDHEGALAAVRRWLATDPLHEPAHRELMRLQADTGDRAAALAQYRECVRTLSRELGVPPLAETTALYEAVNRGTYERRPPTRTPGTGAVEVPVLPPLVGRAPALQSLLDGHTSAGADGRLAVVEGEAGIGKTRLVEELVSTVHSRGGRAVLLRAHEDESGLAYAPLVEALRPLARDASGRLEAVDAAALGEAARLVPELGVTQRPPVAPSPPDGPGAEARFLAALWDVLCAAVVTDDTAGVVVVEDLQWADDATAALVSYGLRRLAGRRLLVVLTWRTPFEHPVSRAAAEVAHAGGGTVLHLDRLDPGQVAELVSASRAGGPDDDLAERLWERTEGVPLLLVEYLRSLVPGTPDLPVPQGVRDVLRARLGPVSETGRQILSAAAVTGRAFDVGTVRTVSGRTDEETVAALEEVTRRGLVHERGDHYDFSHEALRTLVYDDTSLARRRLLHGRAADVPGTPPGAAARHLHLAGRDADAAAAHWRAAEQARDVYANAEALEHLRRADALGYPDRTATLVAAADLQTVVGDYAGALQSLEEAAALAGPEAIATVEQRLGRLQHRRGEWALAEAHLRSALVATPEADVTARAGITADLSLVAHAMRDGVRAKALARDAAALAEEAGDDRARCRAHNLSGMLATVDGDLDAAVAELTRSRRLAELDGDPDLRTAALNNLALALRAGGDLDQATELTREALSLCVQRGDRHREAALHNNLADLAHEQGREEESRAHLRSAVSIFADIGSSDQNRAAVWQLVSW